MTDNTPTRQSENERAFRICLRIDGHHRGLSAVYESLTDRDFKVAIQEIKIIRADLLAILKTIEDDDF